MRDIMQIMGKRLVSKRDMVAFHDYPESEQVTLIPAGQPSGKIDSYLQTGYFQIINTERPNQNQYILDSEHIQVVDENHSDESSLFSRLQSAYAGWWYNTNEQIDKRQDHLKEGFEGGLSKSIRDLTTFSIDLGKNAMQALLVVGVLVAIWFVAKIYFFSKISQ